MDAKETTKKPPLVVTLSKFELQALLAMRQQSIDHGPLSGLEWFVRLHRRNAARYPRSLLAGLIRRHLRATLTPRVVDGCCVDQFAEMAIADAEGRGWIDPGSNVCSPGIEDALIASRKRWLEEKKAERQAQDRGRR